MRFLRTAPTRRLLATLAGALVAAIGCTAIAVAATSGGPVPRAKPLAQAIHDALAAPSPAGISAQVSFTNNLISSSDVTGSDPLLTGATGRLWITKDHFRLELQSSNGDAQVVIDNDSLWIYDPTSNTVYRDTLTDGTGSDQTANANDGTTDGVPSLARIQTFLDKLSAHLTGLTAIPTDVAGEPAYSVRVSPSESGGLLGSVELAWDAAHGVPLSFSVYAKGDSTPVLSLQATAISFGAVPLSVFEISPPSDATVVDLGSQVAVAPKTDLPALTFTTDAPATAGGLTLTEQRRAGRDGELLTYGKGLGAVEVLERPAMQGRSHAGAGSTISGAGQNPSLSLPTETLAGTTTTELITELGTGLQFSEGSIDYYVFGSVPLATANAVATAL